MSSISYDEYCQLIAEIYSDFLEYMKEDLPHGMSLKDIDGIKFLKLVESYIGYSITITPESIYSVSNNNYDEACLFSTSLIYNDKTAEIIISNDILDERTLLSKATVNFALIKEGCSIMITALINDKKLTKTSLSNKYPFSNDGYHVSMDLNYAIIELFGVSSFMIDSISDSQKIDQMAQVLAILFMYDPEDLWSQKAKLEIKKLNGDKNAEIDFDYIEWIKQNNYRVDLRSPRLLSTILFSHGNTVIVEFIKYAKSYSGFIKDLFNRIKLDLKFSFHMKLDSKHPSNFLNLIFDEDNEDNEDND